MRYITYLRVSTQKQGVSGLGLEAQRAAVVDFVSSSDEVIAEYVEVESGKRNDRPRLQEALDHARREDAVLLIAKLDRLARNVAFIANLLEAGVEISAVDLPQANRFVLHIMAAVGEQEAKAISERTKAALKAARARGVKLGWANPARKDRQAAVQASVERRLVQADEFALRHGPRLSERRMSGLTFRQIADEFNRQRISPPRGEQWWASTVRNVLLRYDGLSNVEGDGQQMGIKV